MSHETQVESSRGNWCPQGASYAIEKTRRDKNGNNRLLAANQ